MDKRWLSDDYWIKSSSGFKKEENGTLFSDNAILFLLFYRPSNINIFRFVCFEVAKPVRTAKTAQVEKRR